MILRHTKEPENGLSSENCFEAIDERSGSTLGHCAIYARENDQLFPNRPLRIYIDIEGDPVPDALLGAAVARAKEIALESGVPARVFTQVAPEDKELLAALEALGLKDTDGLVLMRRPLPAGKNAPVPAGCVVVQDELDDPIEQKFFLERYNQLYGESYDFDYFQQLCANPLFKRILLVAPTGMVGEVVLWREGNAGRLFWLFTARKWRNMGVAKCLVDLACDYFYSKFLTSITVEIQARVPNLLKTMEHMGFRQDSLICRYPGTDVG